MRLVVGPFSPNLTLAAYSLRRVSSCRSGVLTVTCKCVDTTISKTPLDTTDTTVAVHHFRIAPATRGGKRLARARPRGGH